MGHSEVNVCFIFQPGGDAVADTAGGIEIAGLITRVVVALALHHAGVKRVAAKNPMQCVVGVGLELGYPCCIRVIPAIPAIPIQQLGRPQSRSRQRSKPGVFTLPPVAAFVLVRKKELHPAWLPRHLHILPG